MGEHSNANKNNDKKTHRQWENLLEMAHVVPGVHQVSSLSKKGVHTSGNDNNFNFNLFHISMSF
jgi:hypothetical protein